MDREKYIDLASLYASGASDAAEAELFEEYLESSASEAEIVILREMQQSLALSAVSTSPRKQPRSSLRDRILQDAAKKGQKEIPDELPFEMPGFSFIDSDEGTWRPLPYEGVRVKELMLDKEDCGYSVILMDFEPGARFPQHHHGGAEQCYVLKGELITGSRRMKAGDFFYAQADSEHYDSYTETGCQVLLVSSDKDYRPKAIRAYGIFDRLVRWLKGLFT